jgi:hypothetical protein
LQKNVVKINREWWLGVAAQREGISKTLSNDDDLDMAMGAP